MLLTDAWLVRLYEQATRTGMPPNGMPLLKAFVRSVFDTLPAGGYIDENNNMNFDEFMLDGKFTRRLYELPELENDDATDK